MRSASAPRALSASQRGLSGTARRIHHTTPAPSEPISTTKRQPSMPNGLAGTSCHASSATIGMAANCTIWLSAKARPRTCLGHDLGDVGVDGDELDAHTDAGEEAPEIESQRGASAAP